MKIMSCDTSSRRIAKYVLMWTGNFPQLEQALVHSIQEWVRYMSNRTLFRQDIICAKALEVRDEMLVQETDVEMSGIDRSALQNFKASGDWVKKFMKRNNLSSKRTFGD